MPSDFLHCHYPLPLPEYQNCNFQTKDLIGKNLNFLIKPEGWLIRIGGWMEGKNKMFYGRIYEMYHGELLFYCRHRSELIAFAAHFWEGQLTKIEFVDDD